MMLREFCMALACLALVPTMAACTNPAGSGPIVTPGVVMDDKAMYAAEAVYNVPAHAYVVADSNGLLNDDLKATVKPLLVSAFNALEGVRTAKRLGDASTFAVKLAELKNFANQANALIPRVTGPGDER